MCKFHSGIGYSVPPRVSHTVSSRFIMIIDRGISVLCRFHFTISFFKKSISTAMITLYKAVRKEAKSV